MPQSPTRVRRAGAAVAVAAVLAAAAACGSDDTDAAGEPATAPRAAGFVLESPAYVPLAPIPRRHTCDGEDLSPALEWAPAPEGTASLALVMEDLDAGTRAGRFTHWIAWGIDPAERGLAEGARPPLEGRNDASRMGYSGPCPPEGEEHRYVVILYALAEALDLEAGADRAAFDAALGSRAEASLAGVYRRSD